MWTQMPCQKTQKDGFFLYNMTLFYHYQKYGQLFTGTPTSFEDKRKENFNKGQEVLEKRRQSLIEEQRKIEEERKKKEQEEAEAREKQKLVYLPTFW